MLSDIGLATDEDSDEEYAIKGEFIANGVNNTIRHEAGVISMARSDYTSYSSSLTEESYNSAGSQFFIVTGDDVSYLDENYAAFGRVTDGMDVVRAIEAVEVESDDDDDSDSSSESSTPVEDVIITSIRVETFGVDYGVPETYEKFNYYNWIYEQYGINLSY
jgi:peptidyl-prolyl cis-trans isomerase B (cyclophilin B)